MYAKNKYVRVCIQDQMHERLRADLSQNGNGLAAKYTETLREELSQNGNGRAGEYH